MVKMKAVVNRFQFHNKFSHGGIFIKLIIFAK